jgi:hypothetical protein
MTRAPTWTAIPVRLPSTCSISPVFTPARSPRSNRRATATRADAARTAAAGLWKRARMPSPAVSTNKPPCVRARSPFAVRPAHPGIRLLTVLDRRARVAVTQED